MGGLGIVPHQALRQLAEPVSLGYDSLWGSLLVLGTISLALVVTIRAVLRNRRR